MKKFIAFFLFLIISQSLWAVKYLVIHQEDGDLISFKLDDTPILTIRNGDLFVNTDTQEFSTSLDKIKDYQLTDDPTSINPISIKGADKIIGIYTIDGKKMNIDVSQLNTLSLGRGVYIIKTKNKTYKLLKK
jgi:hypothetical protein